MKEELNGKSTSLVIPFLVGGVVGAGIALLFAPKSGRELRKGIKDLAENSRDNVTDKVTAAIDAGKDLYDDSRLAVKGAIEAGRQTFVEEREKHHIKAA